MASLEACKKATFASSHFSPLAKLPFGLGFCKPPPFVGSAIIPRTRIKNPRLVVSFGLHSTLSGLLVPVSPSPQGLPLYFRVELLYCSKGETVPSVWVPPKFSDITSFRASQI